MVYPIEVHDSGLVGMATVSRWRRFRMSPVVVIIIVTSSLLTDSLLLTLVDPILPDMLMKMDVDWNTSVADINADGRYGYLVASKGAAQFLCNPFVGMVVTRIGYRLPMLVGDFILLVSTIAFAYSRNYLELMLVRVLQGIASSVTAVTGMGLLASTFADDDQQRGRVMGIAIGGLSIGIIAGPVYGSLMYQFLGRPAPFLLLGAMVLVALVLQILTLRVDPGVKEHSLLAICGLLADPYILLVAGNILLLNLDVSVILAFLPLRLMELAAPPTWQLGLVVLPASVGYLLAGLIFPRFHGRLPRWLCALLGLTLSGTSLVGLAFCRSFTEMMVATTFLGLAIGMVSTAMQPMFALLVDLRHAGLYGNVYAISDMAVCFAMFSGPLVGGAVVYHFGFEWLVIGVALTNLAYSFFSLFLRHLSTECLDHSPGGDMVPKTRFIETAYGETSRLLPPDVASCLRRTSSVTLLPPTPRYPHNLGALDDSYMSEPEVRDPASPHSVTLATYRTRRHRMSRRQTPPALAASLSLST